MSKNVAVFVDVANIFYAAKAAGVDIDYVTLLKAGSAGRDLVRAYAYTGLDPDNENQRNFHDFLRRHGYKVVSKDIRKYGDGKVKANLDIELVVDMMKTARNLDIAIVVSGDGDFAPAIRAVQEMGVRVEVVSFRGNTSSDLIEVADQFTDITQIAKVEKGSSRSGRRVADDEQDLSMTEVPEKQSEGTGESRRGRGRGRGRAAEPVAAVETARGRAAARTVVAPTGDVPIVVLPGEKLSRVASLPPAALASDTDVIGAEADEEVIEATPAGATGEPVATSDADVRRRRRRRGGRGRGRGRAREGGLEAPLEGERTIVDEDDAEVELVSAPPPRRPASTFGSVWDSQIGIPAAVTSATPRAPIADQEDEDFDEPPIPEYLIAEQRQRNAGRPGGRGPIRGRGGAYAAAMDRERFGGGRGSTPSRFAQEPPPRREPAGRSERGDRGGFRPAPRPPRPVSSDEPWSEVPPEIEAMLRAQMGGGQSTAPARRQDTTGAGRGITASPPAVSPPTAVAPGPAPTRRGGRRAASQPSTGAAAAPATEAALVVGDAADDRAPTRRPAPRAGRARSTPTDQAGESAPAAVEGSSARTAPTRPAARRSTATGAGRSRTTRAAAPAPEAESVTAPSEVAAEPAPGTTAPRRRATRKKTDTEA